MSGDDCRCPSQGMGPFSVFLEGGGGFWCNRLREGRTLLISATPPVPASRLNTYWCGFWVPDYTGQRKQVGCHFVGGLPA